MVINGFQAINWIQTGYSAANVSKINKKNRQMDSLYSTELKKMYSDSSFLNVFGFWGLKIKWIPESGEVIVSQHYTGDYIFYL